MALCPSPFSGTLCEHLQAGSWENIEFLKWSSSVDPFPRGKRAQNGKQHVKGLKIEMECGSQKRTKKEDIARIKGRERVCPDR